MSELGFDPKPYCERLAAACPKRFKIIDWRVAHSSGLVQTWLIQNNGFGGIHGLSPDPVQWQFWGPLADERNLVTINRVPMAVRLPDGYVSRGTKYDTILESIIAAVVESFESQHESQNESEVKK